MSIIYTVICKDTNTVLCDYAEYNGNFEVVSRTLLTKIKKESRGTFNYDKM
jgi:hypothetical protein